MSTATLRRDPRSSRRGRGRGASTFPSTKISARNENLQTVALNAQWSGKTSRGSPKPRRGGINRNKGFGNSSPSKVTLRKEENGLDLSESGFMTAAQRAKRFGATNKSMLYDQLKEARVAERQEAIKLKLIPDPNARMRLEDAIDFRGTCTSMCPEFERVEREVQKMLDVLEMDDEGNADPNKTVKRYRRSAAGNEQPLPSDVRPPHILVSTLDYLINDVLMENPFIKCHPFLRDRTRSIRQDFTLQNIRDVTAVHCHERIARFHILSIHELCEYDDDKFSEQQETEQLRKVLLSLMEFYDDLREAGIETPNEAEFRAYFLLTHARDPGAARHLMKLPKHVFEHPWLQRALDLYSLLQRNNEIMQTSARRNKFDNIEACQNFYSKFFKLVGDAQTPFLLACMAEWHFPDVRKGALKAMNKAYNYAHKGVEVEYLRQVLAYDSVHQLLAEAKLYGLVFDTNDDWTTIRFGQRMEKRRVVFFNEPLSNPRQTKSMLLVDPKKGGRTLAQIVNGVNDKTTTVDTVQNVYETQDSTLPGGSVVHKSVIPSKRQLPPLYTVQRVAAVARRIRDDYYADRNSPLSRKTVAAAAHQTSAQAHIQKEALAQAASQSADAQALRQQLLEKQQEIERKLAIEKQHLLEKEREIENQRKQREMEAAKAAEEEKKRQQQLIAQAREQRLAEESRARAAALLEATLGAIDQQVTTTLEDYIRLQQARLMRRRKLALRIARPWLDAARDCLAERQYIVQERNAVYRMIMSLSPPRKPKNLAQACGKQCIAAEARALRRLTGPPDAYTVWRTENFADIVHRHIHKGSIGSSLQILESRPVKPTRQFLIHVEQMVLDSTQWFIQKFGLDKSTLRCFKSYDDVNICFRCIDSNTYLSSRDVDEIGGVIFQLSEMRGTHVDDLGDDIYWKKERGRLEAFTKQLSEKSPQVHLTFLFTHFFKTRDLRQSAYAFPHKMALDENQAIEDYHVMIMQPATVNMRIVEEVEWLAKSSSK